MADIKDQANSVYRDFKVDGVPASGQNDPAKSEIRGLFSLIDVAIAAAQSGIAIVSTIADRDAFYATEANRGKLVYVNNNQGSATDPANGVYEYAGGGPRIAQSFYNGVATVVEPLVQNAVDAADRAEAFARVTETVTAPVAYATTSSRTALLSREPVANDFLVDNFDGLTVTARGSDLAAGGSQMLQAAFETWLSTNDTSATRLNFSLYSRTLVGAANDGAGISGDYLIFSESRLLDQLPGGFARNGTANHVTCDFLRSFFPDPAKLYLLLITISNDSGLSAFGFLQGKGVDSGDPGFPQANGYFRGGGFAWTNFGVNATAAFRWLSAERPGISSTDAAVFALSPAQRTITVGAPEGLLTQTNDATAPGTWWNEFPLVQGGLVTRLYFQARSAGWVTFCFGERGDDGIIRQRRLASVRANGSGWVSLSAGAAFEAFTVEAGWLIGIKQESGIVGYSALGNSFQGNAYFRGATLAMGAVVTVSALPVAPVETKRRRTPLWSSRLNNSIAPAGWDEAPGVIIYGPNGMTLAEGTPRGWGIRVFTHRYVRTDRRVTRVRFDWTTANSRFAVLTAKPSAAPHLDAGFSNSGIEVDGVAGKLRIKYFAGIGDGSGGDPGDVAIGDLGIAMTIGHSYQLEWSLDRTVHSAVLVNLTTSERSPVLTSGPVNFAGIDTNEGFQNGALAFAFVAGNVRFTSVDVLHDGPSPQMEADGDSITKQVFMVPADSWVGRLETGGLTVLRSAQPGGTSIGALYAAWNQIIPSRPRVVVIATGANDVGLPVPLATSRWVTQSMIDLARRVGARVVLTRLHPVPGASVTAYNAMIDALAAGQDDISVWRWDRALTVGGDGVTPNSALLVSDMLHPNAAGASAQFLRLTSDAPTVLD